MAKHNQTGAWGEDLAVELLVKKGYAIRERNWKKNHFEIDIVAEHGGRIVFVEVKTRTDLNENPEEAVDKAKMRRMNLAANSYVTTYDIPHEIQYDIIAVSGTPFNYHIEHIEDAFLPPLKTYR